MHNILVVDDEQSMVDVISEMLHREDLKVYQATSGNKALEIIKNEPLDVIICDIKMDPVDGLDVLRETKKIDPQASFIMITAYGSIENAVECMRAGAYDYITKPFAMEELRLLVRRALEHQRLVQENILLKKQIREKYHFENIVGKSETMQRVYEMMEKVAHTDSTVLIYGESGTGKELVARAIHYHSPRKDKPFVTINCGGLPESLLESELFGHVKGAFTGAISDKMGLFQVANGGTIFLDEISATSPTIQVKLLRVLQEKEIKRVGDTRDVPVDVRVLTATNRRLDEEVGKGTFREDLYYRLSVIPVELPPLRERKDDIPLLVQHFLEKYSGHRKENLKTLAPEVMDIFLDYDWPGNVRELENVIERAVTLCEGDKIFPRDLPQKLIENAGFIEEPAAQTTLKDVMRQKEKEYIQRILQQTGSDKKAAAKILGIDLATLYRKL